MSYSSSLSVVVSNTLPAGSTFITSQLVSWQQSIGAFVLIQIVQGVIFALLTLLAERKKQALPKDPEVSYTAEENQLTSE